VLVVPQGTILANLKDPDVSIRRRALDLLFTMCDGGAAVEVVEELVSTRFLRMRYISLRRPFSAGAHGW
jgi:AP-2 complex subunit alpha